MRADDPKLKRLEPPRLKPWEKFFLPQIAQGLGVTAEHIAGVMFANRAITMQYPEEQHIPSPNYRGVHRLNKDEQGRVKCVACMLWATACPAHCIDIVGTTAPPGWPNRGKYPRASSLTSSVVSIVELRGGLSGRSDRADGSVRPVGIDARANDLRQGKATLGVRRDPAPGADAIRPGANRPLAGNQGLAVPGMMPYRRGTARGGRAQAVLERSYLGKKANLR